MSGCCSTTCSTSSGATLTPPILIISVSRPRNRTRPSILAAGPMVRIHLPPARSQQRTLWLPGVSDAGGTQSSNPLCSSSESANFQYLSVGVISQRGRHDGSRRRSSRPSRTSPRTFREGPSNSIGSDWVEDEVNKAYAEERERKTTVLFPVRIDDVVMTTPEPWARKLRDQRNIGDFRHWESVAQYSKGLERLLRDLKATTSK